MIYHIRGESIVGTSTENLNGIYQVFGPDVIDVQHDEEFGNVLDYRYVNGEFIRMDAVPFTVSKTEIIVDELTFIEIPAGCKILILGERYLFEGVADGTTIEFEAERVGTYQFILTGNGYRETKFQIEVTL